MKRRMIFDKRSTDDWYEIKYKGKVLFTFCPSEFHRYFPKHKSGLKVDVELIPCKNKTEAKADYQIYLQVSKYGNDVYLYLYYGVIGFNRSCEITKTVANSIYRNIKQVDYYGVIVYYQEEEL